MIVAIRAIRNVENHATFGQIDNRFVVCGLVTEVEFGTQHAHAEVVRVYRKGQLIVLCHFKITFTREFHIAVFYAEALRLAHL